MSHWEQLHERRTETAAGSPAGAGPRHRSPHRAVPSAPEGGGAAPARPTATARYAESAEPEAIHGAVDSDPHSRPWNSEAILERGLWRERPAAVAAHGAPPALEQHDAVTPRRRLSRAVAVPVLAGATVLVVAVLIAIAVVALRPGGAGAMLDASASDGGAAGAGVDGAAAEGSAGSAGPGSAANGDAAAGGVRAAPLYVHVVGEVVSPGVVELQAGTRVAEAIEAAGGATGAAVLSGVNLARAVADGEQIVVPNAQQVAEGARAIGQPDAGGAGESGVIDLNTADATALEALPRVGPALAQRIIEWRAANGRFASIDQLLEVPGIGAKTLDGFRELVRV